MQKATHRKQHDDIGEMLLKYYQRSWFCCLRCVTFCLLVVVNICLVHLFTEQTRRKQFHIGPANPFPFPPLSFHPVVRKLGPLEICSTRKSARNLLFYLLSSVSAATHNEHLQTVTHSGCFHGSFSRLSTDRCRRKFLKAVRQY